MTSNVIFAKLDPGFFSNRKIIRAGRNGRDVYLHALCLNAQRGAHGEVPAEDLEPWYLARQLGISESDASEGVTNAVTAKLLEFDGDRVRIVGWTSDWARRAKTRAEIQQDYRKRHKKGEVEGTESYDDEVTRYDSVTALPIRVEERREERVRGNAGENSLSLPPDFEASENARKLAQRRRLDLAFELEQFRDYVAARGGMSSDWDASFRTWLRKSKDVDRKPDRTPALIAQGGAYVSRQRNVNSGETEWVLTEADGNVRVVSEDEAKKHAGYKPPARAQSRAVSARSRSEGARRTGES